MCPHAAQRRRWTHQPPTASHSTHPVPLGGTVGSTVVHIRDEPTDGGAARWAVVASLLATAKLNDVEPFAYLKDVLERMSNGHPMTKLDDLLPWNWPPSNAKT